MAAVAKMDNPSLLVPRNSLKEGTGTIAVPTLLTWSVIGPSGDPGQSAQTSVGQKVQKLEEGEWNKWAVMEELDDVLVKLNRA